MSLVAAFLWKKSPRLSVSTLIFDEETLEILSPAKIKYLPTSFFAFRREAKKFIREFFNEITRCYAIQPRTIKLEYKIVFNVYSVPYMVPALESKFIYKFFMATAKKTKQRIKRLMIKPQLRQKLTGKALKNFNKSLRSMKLVKAKINTRFEYSLWAVALHATTTTYEQKIRVIKNKLMQSFWREAAFD